jgi:tRNA uridine 5-carboxymethylaminomethyl modification enzyme
MNYKDMPNRNGALADEVVQQVEITIKYAGYVERQELEVKKFKTLESKAIPAAFDFSTVPSLRLEARQKLGRIRPATIGQAARISGVSPADISILMVYLKRWGAEGKNNSETNAEIDGVCGLDFEE